MNILYILNFFRCYVIDCRTSTPNIPYADSFYTQTRYCITWAGPEQTRISVCLGITWLKSPFVKSIIKSATYKTFDETCSDYMVCLRQEIAAKIGSSVNSGESVFNANDSKSIAIEGEVPGVNDLKPDEQLKNFEDTWITWTSEKVSEFKIPLLIFIFAFVLGGLIGNYRSIIKPGQILSSYDLELEALREFNSSKFCLSPLKKNWSSQKFQRTHAQLEQLHEDFASVRKSIWYTLQRVNDLEKRVYKAQLAAIMGDHLLACYDQEDNPGCIVLQEQWKSLLKHN